MSAHLYQQGRKRYTRLLTFGRRDFTFVQVSDIPRPDGIRVSGIISVITDRLPKIKGYTRAFQHSIAIYEPFPLSSSSNTNSPNTNRNTKVTVIGRVDLNDSSDGGDGGNIPMWLYVKTVGRTGVHFCRTLRKELDRRMSQSTPTSKPTYTPTNRPSLETARWINDNQVETNFMDVSTLFDASIRKMRKQTISTLSTQGRN